MKYIKQILVILLLVVTVSCDQYWIDEPMVIKEVKINDIDDNLPKYEIKVGFLEYVRTDSLYSVGDTIYFSK